MNKEDVITNLSISSGSVVVGLCIFKKWKFVKFGEINFKIAAVARDGK